MLRSSYNFSWTFVCYLLHQTRLHIADNREPALYNSKPSLRIHGYSIVVVVLQLAYTRIRVIYQKERIAESICDLLSPYKL